MDGQSHAQLQASDIYDLRTALEFLSGIPGQLVATDVPVDPYLELAGVYRRVGSGTPVAPPTRVGPALHPVRSVGHASVQSAVAHRRHQLQDHLRLYCPGGELSA
jgi:4-hydroxy-3-polyprenylbenzoate decarboxylase